MPIKRDKLSCAIYLASILGKRVEKNLIFTGRHEIFGQSMENEDQMMETFANAARIKRAILKASNHSALTN